MISLNVTPAMFSLLLTCACACVFPCCSCIMCVCVYVWSVMVDYCFIINVIINIRRIYSTVYTPYGTYTQMPATAGKVSCHFID